jgi:lysophospholipase L1-like esterase
VPSAVTIAAMGDSLTAPYAGAPYGAAGDRNWVEQLRANDARLVVDDFAVSSATSADLLAQAQDAAAAADKAARYAVLIIGANDVSAHLSDFVAGDPAPFVSQVVANVETALHTAAAAGKRLAVGTIPDVTLTPAFQAEIAAFGPATAALSQEISGAVAAANQQIEAYALDRGIPVIDLAALGKLAQGPFVVGGVQVTQFYTPDGFHPGTVAQGVLADAVLNAFSAYDPGLQRFRLTDQQILDDAGIAHAEGHTFFDVSSYVILPQSPCRPRNAADASFAAYLNDLASAWHGLFGRAEAEWQRQG